MLLRTAACRSSPASRQTALAFPPRRAIFRWQDRCVAGFARLHAGISRASNWYNSMHSYPACVFLGHSSGRTAILEFFSSRRVAELAKSMAHDVAKRYPPAIANNPAQMVSQQRLSGILEEVFARATEFSQKNKLGWYKKATLGNDFRWELTELGYDKKFVDSATEGLILCVSRNPSLKA
jgi:hypothetical protein